MNNVMEKEGVKGEVTERKEITGLWNLLSLSLVEGENRADFGENPFTNATNATTTRKKLVDAYIFGRIRGNSGGNGGEKERVQNQKVFFFFYIGIFRVSLCQQKRLLLTFNAITFLRIWCHFDTLFHYFVFEYVCCDMDCQYCTGIARM